MCFLSLSYCNIFIRLHNFVEKHDNILKYALRLEFIRKNFTMLNRLFKNWGGKKLARTGRMVPTKQEFCQAHTYAISTRFSDLGFPKCITTCVQSSVYLRRKYTHQ